MDEKKITIIISYYNQCEALLRHVSTWNSFPTEVKKKFSFIVVDDCSENTVMDVLEGVDLGDLDIRVYRINTDIPWNQPGAHNLGMKQCETKWAMITDMSQLVTEEIAYHLIGLIESANEDDVFRFYIIPVIDDVEHDRMVHRKICLIRKKDFWRVGGYDEDFCGKYGHDDNAFWNAVGGKLIQRIVNDITFSPDMRKFGKTRRYRRKWRPNAKLWRAKYLGKVPRSKNYIRFEWKRQL